MMPTRIGGWLTGFGLTLAAVSEGNIMGEGACSLARRLAQGGRFETVKNQVQHLGQTQAAILGIAPDSEADEERVTVGVINEAEADEVDQQVAFVVRRAEDAGGHSLAH